MFHTHPPTRPYEVAVDMISVHLTAVFELPLYSTISTVCMFSVLAFVVVGSFPGSTFVPTCRSWFCSGTFKALVRVMCPTYLFVVCLVLSLCRSELTSGVSDTTVVELFFCLACLQYVNLTLVLSSRCIYNRV